MNNYFEKWFDFCSKQSFIIRGILGCITILITVIWLPIVISMSVFDKEYGCL